jgi:hypothetical protein
MAKKKTDARVSSPQFDGLIYTVRGVRVMLDRDLAEIYGVATRSSIRPSNAIKAGFRKISCFSSRWRKPSPFVVQDHKM